MYEAPRSTMTDSDRPPPIGRSIRPAQSQLHDLFARMAVVHSPDAMHVADTQSRILWANPAFTKATGYGPDDFLSTNAGALLFGEETDPVMIGRIRDAVSRGEAVRCEVLLYLAGGDPGWFDLQITPIHGTDGKTTHFLSTLRALKAQPDPGIDLLAVSQDSDLELIGRAERKLLSQSSGWFYAAKTLDELLKIVNRCMRTLMPEAAGQLFIYGPDRTTLNLASHWGPTFFTDHILPDDCWSLRRGRAYAYGNGEIDFPCAHHEDDNAPSFCLPVIAHGDTIGLLHLVFNGLDLREELPGDLRRRLEPRWDLALICAEQISLAVANVRLRQELQTQSMRDQLTGLWNRRWFLETAQRELNRALARVAPMALVSVDIDHFKSINDNFGHDAGDTVLREIAGQIERCCGAQRSVCRLGGEEFMVLAPNTDREEARLFAEELRAAVADMPLRLHSTVLPGVTVSCGVALVPESGDELTQLMTAADVALYKAKEDGRDRVVVHDVRSAGKTIAA